MNGAEAAAAATAAASRRWLRLWTNIHEGALRGSSRGGGGGEGGKKPTQVDHVTTCKKHTSSSFCQTRNSNCRRTHRQHKLKRAIKYAFRRLSRGRDQFTGYHTLTTWHLNSHKTLFINSPTDPSREIVVVCCCFFGFFQFLLLLLVTLTRPPKLHHPSTFFTALAGARASSIVCNVNWILYISCTRSCQHYQLYIYKHAYARRRRHHRRREIYYIMYTTAVILL